MEINVIENQVEIQNPIKIKKRLVPCCVCSKEHFTVLFPDELGNIPPPVDYNFSERTRKTFQIVKCETCNFIFTNPMPNLSDFYIENVDEVYLQAEIQRKKSAEEAVKHILKLKPSGKLLDIGCATGIFLDAAKKHYDTEGIELSEWAAKIAIAKHHIVHPKPLNKLNFSQQFDIITLWGVIEHFEDPFSEMKAVYDALKPGGIAVIYTGDVDAWLPKVLGKKWWWFQGMHLMYFSKSTLTKLLERIGFQVIKYHNHCSYFQLFSLANSLNRYATGKFISPLLYLPFIKNIMIPLKLSGEMVLYARKH